MKRTLIVFLLVNLMLSACAPAPTPMPASALTPTPAHSTTPWPVSTPLTLMPHCGPSIERGVTLSEEEMQVFIDQGYNVITISTHEVARLLGASPCVEILGDTPVPIYPGAVRHSDMIPLPISVVLMIPDVPITETRNYWASDSPDQVLAWYEQTLPEVGLEYEKDHETGVLRFRAGHWRYGLFAAIVQGETYFWIATGYE